MIIQLLLGTGDSTISLGTSTLWTLYHQWRAGTAMPAKPPSDRAIYTGREGSLLLRHLKEQKLNQQNHPSVGRPVFAGGSAALSKGCDLCMNLANTVLCCVDRTSLCDLRQSPNHFCFPFPIYKTGIAALTYIMCVLFVERAPR